MSEDIVTRLRGKEHGDNDLRCKSCDSFCCHCELCDCCLEILEVCLEAADEIERLRAVINRWNNCEMVAESLCLLDDPESLCRWCEEKAVRSSGEQTV